MHRTRPRVWIPALLLVALLAPRASRAELFAELRLGAAFTEDGDVEFDVPGLGTLVGEAEFDDSVTVGGRAGYWFLPWIGLAGDVSYFAPDEDTGAADIDVIPISPLLMLRLPLADDSEFPNGRVQPFMGIGPGIFVSTVDFGGDDDDTTVDVGLDAHAGINFLVTPNVGLFVQYRYTMFTSETEISGVDIEADLDTHHAAAGLGFHF